MARPKKKTVDYFPHIIKHGKTITILENKFGNDGYAFWFKLLEILASTDGHFYDYNNPVNQEFLYAKTLVNKDIAENILNLLAKLEAIDLKSWEEGIIWSKNFVENVSEVYRRRGMKLPQNPINGALIKRNSSEEKPPEELKSSTPYKEIIDLYHFTCAKLPKVIKITDNRKKKIKSLYNFFQEDVKEIEKLFKKVAESRFLSGSSGKWRASFDWLVNASNAVKVLEGNYDDRKSEQTQFGIYQELYDEAVEEENRE